MERDMNMPDGNVVALNQYLESQAKAETQWESFEGTPSHEAMRQRRFETLLSDPDNISEALSFNGIKYPFNDCFLGKTEHERAALRKRINDFDDNLARQLAVLIITKDDAELGRILRVQAEQYFKKSIDEWVDDNWRDWV